MAQTGKKRLPLELSLEAYERLQKLQEGTGTSTLSEVVRDALRVYSYLHEQHEEGWKTHLVNGDRARELLLFLDPPKPKTEP